MSPPSRKSKRRALMIQSNTIVIAKILFQLIWRKWASSHWSQLKINTSNTESGKLDLWAPMASRTKKLTSLLPKLLGVSSTNLNNTYRNNSWSQGTINPQPSSPSTNKWVLVPKNFQNLISTASTAITAFKKMQWLTKWISQVQDGTRTKPLQINLWQLWRKLILGWRLSKGGWIKKRRTGRWIIEVFSWFFSYILIF